MLHLMPMTLPLLSEGTKLVLVFCLEVQGLGFRVDVMHRKGLLEQLCSIGSLIQSAANSES